MESICGERSANGASVDLSPRRLFEVFRSAFGALALAAFRDVLETTCLQNCLHCDFAATIGTDEFLRGNSGARVFTCSGHFVPPKSIQF